MVVESVKKVKNIVSEVDEGMLAIPAAVAAGILPPKNSYQLKRLKEGAQAEKKD